MLTIGCYLPGTIDRSNPKDLEREAARFDEFSRTVREGGNLAEALEWQVRADQNRMDAADLRAGSRTPLMNSEGAGRTLNHERGADHISNDSVSQGAGHVSEDADDSG